MLAWHLQVVAAELDSYSIKSCRLACSNWSFGFIPAIRKVSIRSSGLADDRRVQTKLLSKVSAESHVELHVLTESMVGPEVLVDQLLEDLCSNRAIQHVDVVTTETRAQIGGRTDYSALMRFSAFLQQHSSYTFGIQRTYGRMNFHSDSISWLLSGFGGVAKQLRRLTLRANLKRADLALVAELTGLQQLAVGLATFRGETPQYDEGGRLFILQDQLGAVLQAEQGIILPDLQLGQLAAVMEGQANFASAQQLQQQRTQQQRVLSKCTLQQALHILAALPALQDLCLPLNTRSSACIKVPAWQHLTRLAFLARPSHRPLPAPASIMLPKPVCATLCSLQLDMCTQLKPKAQLAALTSLQPWEGFGGRECAWMPGMPALLLLSKRTMYVNELKCVTSFFQQLRFMGSKLQVGDMQRQARPA